MVITSITVVAEAGHPVIWEFNQAGVPFDVTGRTYAMRIRKDPASATGEVPFTCVATGNRAECTGDCSSLTPGDEYQFQVAENGLAIISGTVAVVPRFA